MKTLLSSAGALAMAASLYFASPAMAASAMTSEAFLQARLQAFGSGNLEALLEQYSEDATLFTPQGALHGKAQIKTMLQAVLAEFGQPGSKFNLVSQAAVGSSIALVWNAETSQNIYELGVETYVLADGKVATQTTVLKVTPK